VVLGDPRGPVGMACARVLGFETIAAAAVGGVGGVIGGVVAGITDDGLQLIDVDALLGRLEGT
jgi:hypothetical protein